MANERWPTRETYPLFKRVIETLYPDIRPGALLAHAFRYWFYSDEAVEEEFLAFEDEVPPMPGQTMGKGGVRGHVDEELLRAAIPETTDLIDASAAAVGALKRRHEENIKRGKKQKDKSRKKNKNKSRKKNKRR